MASLPASAIAELQAALANDRAINASLALVVYEYLITLEHEWKFLRARRWSVVTWLFLFNRYLMLAVAIQKAPVYSEQECQNTALNDFLEVLALLPFAVAAAFSALRVYALMDRTITIAVIVFILSIVPMGTNGYGLSKTIQVFVNNPATGSSCAAFSSVSQQANFAREFGIPMALSTRLAVIVADVIVLAVTWYKTFNTVKRASSIGLSVKISETLLQDGSVYFIIMLGLNIYLVICNTVTVAQGFVIPVILSDIMQPMLVSRFLINLRQTDTTEEEENTYEGDASQSTTVNFRRPTVQSVIGNIGGSLYDGLQEPSDEDTFDEELGGTPSRSHDA